MQFALFTSGEFTEWGELVELWKYAEQSGWDAVFIDDHFMPDTPNPVGDYLECWTSLAGLSQLTERIRIGTLVTGNPYRHPAILAKMATNVDIMSGGRLVFGIGAGWQENEHLAYGIPFDSPGERLDKLEEACQVILSLWKEERANLQGEYYTLRDAPLEPKPAQKPHPEFLIGGGGIKRTLRIVAQYADHWNDWGGPRNFAYKNPFLEKHCEAAGRSVDDIVRSACMALLMSEQFAEQESLHNKMKQMFAYDSEQARDAVLAGSIAEIRDKISEMENVGVDMICIPTFVREIPRKELDQFMSTVAVSFQT
jgi:F420-dependent oxidoreductase-like protein